MIQSGSFIKFIFKKHFRYSESIFTNVACFAENIIMYCNVDVCLCSGARPAGELTGAFPGPPGGEPEPHHRAQVQTEERQARQGHVRHFFFLFFKFKKKLFNFIYFFIFQPNFEYFFKY